ncbi:rhomboid-like protein [Streptomyces noursei]|uniref:rhomboid-like protein n=1 Tax=Streptomyces noursei TaxID=1971 RepID=UPI0023B7DE4F|nr:rhomboid-like protein [Streptomyces noursei]
MASAVETAGGPPVGDGAAEAAPVLLTGLPRQRGNAVAPAAPAADAPPAPPDVPAAVAVAPTPARRSRPRPWRLLPTPTGTPFTFCYAVLLVGTSLYADRGDPSVVSALLQGSSTDVVHLAQAPLLVLVASALWSAGGLLSGYALAFLFVLTALERRIGGVRSAAVFFGGHALATLATELPVGFSVAAGGLPDSSLHRLDYGISFGVMTCIGALAGLLPAWLRWPLLVAGGCQVLSGLLAYVDPMTDWGHALSLALGIAAWPLLRYWRAQRSGPAPLLGDLGHPALRPGRAV